jgi:hypothetical protein
MDSQTLVNAESWSGWVVVAGLIVSACAHFGIVLQANDIITVIVGAITLVASIKALLNHKAVVNAARTAGAIAK